jgi:asparagine synthase (glutamine-hydrolysing)
MCGIAGYASPTPISTAQWQPRLQAAADCMAERGPDDQGQFHTDRIGLVHRRLSIIDLDGGHQPLVDPQTGAVIVFNGEIYNYRDVRTELHAAGHAFLTHSDTEVLLHAFLEWGVACLDRLLGMFAFAIYEPRNHALFLARDRLGVKPLFWAQQRHTFCFASSMRALLALLPEKPALDASVASHYLSTIRINLGQETLLCGVRLLDPGHWMRIDANGGQQAGCYWAPSCPPPQDKSRLSLEAAAGATRDMIEEAVRLRLISDVPLGGFLSGGLDSTIIADHASKLTGNHYHAYSVGYPQPGFNEFPFAKEAADTYRMKCRQIALEANDYPALWTSLIRQNGLPLTTPNEVPIFMLSKALREEYTVALSGEGADEIFGGYTIAYFAAHDFDRAMRSPDSKSELNETDHALLRGYGQAHLPDLATHHLLLNAWMSTPEKQLWMHPDITASLNNDHAISVFYHQLYNRYPHASTLDRIMLAHLRVNLEGLLLRVDSSSMAASVETRVPFTDHRLVDFAFSLPDSYRLDWRQSDGARAAKGLNVMEIVQQDLIDSKRLLRHAYADSIPQSILRRPKMSFPVPVFDWMDGWMNPMIRDAIAASPLRNTLFNPTVIDAWLNGSVPVHPMKLWPIVNLCLWHDTL